MDAGKLVERYLDTWNETDPHARSFAWELVPASGGEPLAIGFDVAVTEEDGRIGRLFGFLDKAPGA